MSYLSKEQEKVFKKSWVEMLAFFDPSNSPVEYQARDTKVCEIIHSICEGGYNKTLRAGQSMNVLVISRSKEHGLKEEQESISCGPGHHGLGMDICYYGKKAEEHHFSRAELNETFIKMLKKLEQQPIE